MQRIDQMWRSCAALAAALGVLLVPSTLATGSAVVMSGPEVAATAAEGGGAPLELSVHVRDLVSSYEVMPILAMPGERVVLEARASDPSVALRASATGGRVARSAEGEWTWEAPTDPGLYDIRLEAPAARAGRQLAAFVLRPYVGEQTLNGYRIGHYAEQPLRGDPAYIRPGGLIEVTPENRGTRISPHFRLEQFLCKQDSGYPKYVLVQPRLIMQLERLVDRLERRGLDAGALFVMSGYRTPAYNAAIGNDTTYSRHAYGDAADVFIDRDGNGWMDDLDGDGRETTRDAQLLYDEVEGLAGEHRALPLVGGLGLYGPKPHRGPFVHLDTRGHWARW